MAMISWMAWKENTGWSVRQKLSYNIPDNIYKSMSPTEDIFLKFGIIPRMIALPHPCT